MKKYQMFVNGVWMDAVEGETESVINPATEKPIAEVPRESEKDVDRAAEAAAAAFEKWFDSTLGGKTPSVSRGVDSATPASGENSRIFS
jgi:aldehyde dehydrogenase (NAD+)